MEWDVLKQEALACTKCELHKTRTNVVFGVGKLNSRVVFVGEAPGANEDLLGEPFVGRSGKLLDEMLLSAGLSRDKNIFIGNMIKCRPPDNRDPSKEELRSCIGYLNSQLEIINPKLVVCVGRIAAQYFISKDFKITKQRGEIFNIQGRAYTAILHPAAILRNINQKPDAMKDIENIKKYIENV